MSANTTTQIRLNNNKDAWQVVEESLATGKVLKIWEEFPISERRFAEALMNGIKSSKTN
jgi:hypothetical protein